MSQGLLLTGALLLSFYGKLGGGVTKVGVCLKETKMSGAVKFLLPGRFAVRLKKSLVMQ